jgi:internalin A
MAKRTPPEDLSEAARRIKNARSRSSSKLDLHSLDLTELPESLGQLIHLRELDLGGNKLSSLSEPLWQLRQLQKLSLRNNQLDRVSESIGQLNLLRELYLCGNELSLVPESLGQCRQLQKLDISGNLLQSVPESLGELDQLRELNVSGNRLLSLPTSLGKIIQLQRLDLSGNRLLSLPESIGRLNQLRELYASGNRISFVPESFGHLSALRMLDLSNNPLKLLPLSMNNLLQLKQFYLHGIPVLGIPPEVLGPTRETAELKGSTPADPSGILRYYFQIRAAKRPLNEVKLILMGRGGVGKTSLVSRMVRDEFDPSSAKTDGIQITQWPVKVARESVGLHIWDFGGQEIMHATHQFFLSERSIYLVVLSGREGSEDEDAEYWLKLAASFGAGSPVLVVLNKMQEHRFDVNRRALQQKYPSIREFVDTDCESGLGIEDLKKALSATLSDWKGWRVDFPPPGSISRSVCQGCRRATFHSISSRVFAVTMGKVTQRHKPLLPIICTTLASP